MVTYVAACLALPAAVAPALADGPAKLDEALKAYHDGAFEQALQQALPLAEDGLAEAQYLIGVLLETGQGVSRNMHQAVNWYRRAAEKNHLEATKRLALINFSGAHMWTSKVRAVIWFRKAAQLGDVASQGFMGRIYENGWGVEPDIVEALKWFTIAAHHGNAAAQRDKDRIEFTLSEEQIAQARGRAAETLQIDPAEFG